MAGAWLELGWSLAGAWLELGWSLAGAWLELGWGLQTSNYRKLRLSVEWVIAQLEAAGFHVVNNDAEQDMNYLIACFP